LWWTAALKTARQRVLTVSLRRRLNFPRNFRGIPMSLAPTKSSPPSQARVIALRMRNGQFSSGVGARNSSFVLLAVAMLGLDVGVARITHGVVLRPSRATCNST
jgi:hypothetical protein